MVVDALRARLVDEDGWKDLQQRAHARIEARRRRYGGDPREARAKLADVDRKIANFFHAIGDGLDPATCKALIADLQVRKKEIEVEAARLQGEDYYVAAVEKNIQRLAAMRRHLGPSFAELPFGARRKLILEFVAGI